jgi:alkylated DNA repair dioxygenase AlkB
MDDTTIALSDRIRQALQALDWDEVHRRYWAQHECVLLEHVFPYEMLAHALLPEVEGLRAEVHRNYIPRHKKGGSVSYYALVEKAPAVLTRYRHPVLLDFLSRLVGVPVMPCPDDDPHACALYFYTEPGDHIGFHYDTSYYRGARYTVLVGLVQRSQHCQLVCQLYKDDPPRERQDLQLATDPDTMVIFNGDKLWHAVTPLEPEAERIMLSMEYVTNPTMGAFQRCLSNLKDAIAYFGVSALVRGRRGARHTRTTAGHR